jgi:NitT/TauT family transport system ATP-binding protein
MSQHSEEGQMFAEPARNARARVAVGRIPRTDMRPALAAETRRGGGLRHPAVEIRAVRKVFGAIEAIKSISFTVADGEFVSVLGPSGCGKTTLLLLIAGLTGPTEGDVRIGGVRVTGPQRATGVVFQTPVLLPWRTILDNVLLPVELLWLPAER